MEFRVPSASANAYFVVAGLIAAGLDGIENKLECPADVKGDAYLPSPEGINDGRSEQLSNTLEDALAALEADTVICEALGNRFVHNFLQMKRDELIDLPKPTADEEADAKELQKWCKARYQPLI
jgi:glutamine synthetase